MTCIFCDIVNGKAPSFLVWQDEHYQAFLSIFPNTQGVTVVIPKKHTSSYAFDLPPQELAALTCAAQKVAHILDAKLPTVGRTALVYEGFGVDHVHAKLFPMHGTALGSTWEPTTSKTRRYTDVYEGFISTHDSERANDEELAKLATYLQTDCHDCSTDK